MSGEYSVGVFVKKDIRDDIRKKFPRDDGSGFSFIDREYDVSWSRSTKKLAVKLAERVKKAFPASRVDAILEDGTPFWRNGKIRGPKGKWVKP